LARLGPRADVIGLGVAAQRSTVVFWDAETGKPAARAPSWQDGRAVSAVSGLQAHQARAHETTGLYLTPYYSAPKIRWFLDNVPAVRVLREAGRLRVGPVSTWLVWRLTKGRVFAADPSTAQRMMLLDLRTLDWDPFLLELFGIPREILPEIRPSAGDWGEARRGKRALNILAVIGDQQAAALGLGARDEGQAVANYGTGAFFLLNTGARQHRIPGLLTSVGWSAKGKPPCFLQEGTVHAAGASFDWLRGSLKVLGKGEDLDRVCRASKERVFALSAIGGLGAPRWDYTTKTAFFGLSSRTTPADLARGVVEGVGFLISDIVAAMRAGGLSPRAARVSGGLSRVEYLMQFQADLLQLPLERCAEAEATALGAAQLAADAAGAAWKTPAPRIDKRFMPKMKEPESAALRGGWAKFVSAQARLSRELAG
jgi:glycerol kinase